MASRGPLLLGALWAAAAALSVGVGLVAVDLVSGEVGEDVGSPLSDDAVRTALGSTTPTPEPIRSPHAEPDADDGPLRTVSTRGGVVSARCTEGEPRLLYATPTQGYRTERAEDDEVRFMSSSRVVRVRMSCSGGQLVASTRTESLPREPVEAPTTRAPEPSPSEHEDETHSPEPSESHDSED